MVDVKKLKLCVKLHIRQKILIMKIGLYTYGAIACKAFEKDMAFAVLFRVKST